ncbi:hypothetical protein ACJMQP_00740 [Rhodopseudomonas palustris]
MMEQFITIEKSLDRIVFDTLQEAARRFKGTAYYYSTAFDFQLNPADEGHTPIIERILSMEGYLISRATLTVPGFSVEFIRGTNQANSQPSSAIFDQLRTNSNNSNSLNEIQKINVIELLKFIQTKFSCIRPELAAAAATEEQARVQALHNSIIERLEYAATKQIEQINSFLREKQDEIADHRKKLEDEFTAKRNLLEEETQQEREKLKGVEAELATKQKLLDDRDNTHVRRAIRQDLNRILTERLSNTKINRPSLLRELGVHIAFLSVLTISGYLILYYSSHISEYFSRNFGLRAETIFSDPPMITIIAKQILSSITLVATAIYYIRWLIRQYQRYFDTEDEIRKYQIDFERASWVVETALEWRKDQSTQIPDSLLIAISRRLFEFEKRDGDGDVSPADMLASALIGTASKVNLNTGIAQIEIDGRKLQKAQTK